MVSRSRVPNQGKLLDDYFPSRFLKAHDFFRWRVTEYLVTISRAVEEEVTPRPGEKEWKLVLYFSTKDGEEYPRGYLVSAKADVDVLRGMGVVAVRDLVGVRVLVCLAGCLFAERLSLLSGCYGWGLRVWEYSLRSGCLSAFRRIRCLLFLGWLMVTPSTLPERTSQILWNYRGPEDKMSLG